MSQNESPGSFKTLKIVPALSKAIDELGFTSMTHIQAQSLPLLLQGRDLVGQSKTGSGKTLAFMLPVLQKIVSRAQEHGVTDLAETFRDRTLQALVLSPTRELCAQVTREGRKLGRHLPGLQILSLSGGQPIHPQLDALEKGVHIVVGTPGRILDHIKRRSLDLSRVEFLILDEADRMLDMGFEDDMREILNEVPRKRQTVFFSATFPDTIDSMSRKFQKDPAKVTIDDGQTTVSIRQVCYAADPEEKFDSLLWVLQKYQPESAIVFCNLKASCDQLLKGLAAAGVHAGSIHGDLEQRDRDRVMAKFRNHSIRVLIATDVAARGIDIESLDAVINFDLPAQPEVYVHRIGRTGRAGKKGLAISFITSREDYKLKRIEELTKTATVRRKIGDEDPQSGGRQILKDAEMVTLWISGGRKDKVRPGDILGALTGEAGSLNGTDIGKIEIHDTFSYVAISKAIAHRALNSLRNGRIKGKKFRIEPVR